MVDETAPDPLQALGVARVVRRPVLTVAYPAEHAGARLLLEREVTLGRGGDAFGPSALQDHLLSREHLALSRRGAEVVARDEGSRNGSFVNGKRIEEVALREGDVVGIGGMLLVYGQGPAELPRVSDPLIAGVSAARARLLEDIRAVAAQDVTVLIRGETGVGKELVARRIHELSGRGGELVAVNCGAVSDGVVGSELFGHVRGAFSGADADRAGLVHSAAGGTLLLDEIGDASPQVQTSLLRLLQDRVYRAVGSDAEKTSDARFIAATHVRLDPAVREGRFRQDLLARLRRWVITVPPLRERREDILPIAEKLASGRAIDRPLATALLLADWPDNARGLGGVIENAIVDADGAALTLTPRVQERLDDMGAPAAEEQAVSEEAQFRKKRPDADYLARRLSALDGNVKAFAQELGVARNTLYRWLREGGIDPKAVR